MIRYPLALAAPLAAVLLTAGTGADARRYHRDGHSYNSRAQYEACRHQRRKASNRGTAIGAAAGGVGTALAGGSLGGSLLGAGVGAVAGRVVGRETGPRCPY